MKIPLLFLCHRIPYPPNKGDKIRSFHLLHHLSKHFDIYLATFVDDAADWPYIPDVEKHCRDSLFIEQKKWPSRLRSLTGLVTGQALSIPYYGCREMQTWVTDTVRERQIKHAMIFSSAMAQYVLESPESFERKVVDFVDVDSDKWEQYAENKPWPLSWLYRREARQLLTYEKHLAHNFDAGLFVSSVEAEFFKKLSPETAHKIGFYNQGVNCDYYRAAADCVNPFSANSRVIVFTGAMDYWPNVDAVVWFVGEVMPGLRATHPDVQFCIVGSNPSKVVRQLAAEPGVMVTGRVEDVRPYLQFAVAAVAPMRIARGVQTKVLEAMAMEKRVVVSTKGLEGIAANDTEHVLIADSAVDYVNYLTRILAGEYLTIGATARRYVARDFNWDINLPEVVLLIAADTESAEQHTELCHE